MEGAQIPFVCPRCRGALADRSAQAQHAYECGACAVEYPVLLGIPDFRVAPDPWIGIEDDREKGLRLEATHGDGDLESMVRAYWRMTPETPGELAERFVRHVLTAERRSRQWLEWLDATEGHPPSGPWLDLGCGTGDLVVAAAKLGCLAVGIDVAFRWLVVARRRLSLAGVHAPLVCCNAEHLPFPDGAFARVVSLGMLEHSSDADGIMREGRRVLVPRGQLATVAANRYTALPEPHVNVWGVGYVPRRLADRYVRWRASRSYVHHRPLSPRELGRGMRGAGLSSVRVGPAPLLPSDRGRLGRMAWAGDVYEAARRLPLIGATMSWVAPLLDGRGTAP